LLSPSRWRRKRGYMDVEDATGSHVWGSIEDWRTRPTEQHHVDEQDNARGDFSLSDGAGA
jgi:hypothetical protein